MNLVFTKYHGAGNDFVVVDDRKHILEKANIKELARSLCHRRFGIGADGLLLLRNYTDYDFEMVYVNSNGTMGAMCGNGGRCIVHYANSLGIVPMSRDQYSFLAADGPHLARLTGEHEASIQMTDVNKVGIANDRIALSSGTTRHHIQLVENLSDFPVFTRGRELQKTSKLGMNVNFVEIIDEAIYARVYERGVENETLACGTGATSIAIGLVDQKIIKRRDTYPIYMPGGTLTISFDYDDGVYHNIWLTGPAVPVFVGEIEVDIEKSAYFLPMLPVKSPVDTDNLS